MENNQVMRFSIEDGKLKAEIDIADIVYLFHTFEDNYDGDGDVPYAVVKDGKEEELAKSLIRYLLDDDATEDWPNWAGPLNKAFREDWLEDYKPEFLAYYEDGEVTPGQLAKWKKDNGLS